VSSEVTQGEQAAQQGQVTTGEVTPAAAPQLRKLRWGIAYIYASTNNTMIIITDLTGAETVAGLVGGRLLRLIGISQAHTRP